MPMKTQKRECVSSLFIIKPAGWRAQRGLAEGKAGDSDLKVPQMLWARSRRPGGHGSSSSPGPWWHLTGTGPRRACGRPGCLCGRVAAAGRGVRPLVASPHRERVRRGSHRTISRPFLEAEDAAPEPTVGHVPRCP